MTAKKKKIRRKGAATKPRRKLKSRKTPKADTATAQLQAVRDAASAKPLDPPGHCPLRKCDRPFWDEIIEARARSTWNDIDLQKAVFLARTMADIVRVQKSLSGRDIVTNRQGTPLTNPLHQILETLSKRSVYLARALHVHASATQGRSRDTGDKTKRERAAKRAVKRAEEDPLIAPPTPDVDADDGLLH